MTTVLKNVRKFKKLVGLCFKYLGGVNCPKEYPTGFAGSDQLNRIN